MRRQHPCVYAAREAERGAAIKRFARHCAVSFVFLCVRVIVTLNLLFINLIGSYEFWSIGMNSRVICKQC